MNRYEVNNLIRLSVQFQVLIGSVPVDPTSVKLLVKKPDQTVDTYTLADGQVIRDSVGNYHYDLVNAQCGYYYYQFEGGGNIIAEQSGQFNSFPSPFGSL